MVYITSTYLYIYSSYLGLYQFIGSRDCEVLQHILYNKVTFILQFASKHDVNLSRNGVFEYIKTDAKPFFLEIPPQTHRAHVAFCETPK